MHRLHCANAMRLILFLLMSEPGLPLTTTSSNVSENIVESSISLMSFAREWCVVNNRQINELVNMRLTILINKFMSLIKIASRRYLYQAWNVNAHLSRIGWQKQMKKKTVAKLHVLTFQSSYLVSYWNKCSGRSSDSFPHPDAFPRSFASVAGCECRWVIMKLTAAGTVQDLHLIPY